MKETFAVWDASDYIETPEDERLHLEVYAEEDPGDGSMVRAALRDIAKAQNITRLANEAGLTRRSVYKALSAEGNPSMATLSKIAKALGLRLRLGLAGEASGDASGVLPEWMASAVIPGEVLKNQLAASSMSPRQLAKTIGRPVATVNEIVKGKKAITPQTAIELEGVFDITADDWMSMQAKRWLANERSKVKATEGAP